jgi:hypothetical protein
MLCAAPKDSRTVRHYGSSTALKNFSRAGHSIELVKVETGRLALSSAYIETAALTRNKAH